MGVARATLAVVPREPQSGGREGRIKSASSLVVLKLACSFGAAAGLVELCALSLLLLSVLFLFPTQGAQTHFASTPRAPFIIEDGEDVVHVTIETPGHRYDEAVSVQNLVR